MMRAEISKNIITCALLGLLFMAHTTTNAQTQPDAVAEDQHLNTLADQLSDDEVVQHSQTPHIRKKRLVWITDDGRLALPPGTSLTFTPTIALPLVRHPPEGFFSNITISFPVTIDFDKLGLTDNQNPLGDLPPFFARSFGHSAGHMLGEYIARYLHVQRRKRDLSTQQSSSSSGADRDEHFVVHEEPQYPELPAGFKHIFHGGERVLLYGVVEDFLATFGMDGKACLLRTICEMHSRSLDKFGVFGEMAKLFLTVTKSPFADLLPEYVRAQQVGEGREGPGECFPYYKECPKSIFKALTNKYSSAQSATSAPKGEYYEQQVTQLQADKQVEQQEMNTNMLPLSRDSNVYM